jgi:hypothetical protein
MDNKSFMPSPFVDIAVPINLHVFLFSFIVAHPSRNVKINRHFYVGNWYWINKKFMDYGLTLLCSGFSNFTYFSKLCHKPYTNIKVCHEPIKHGCICWMVQWWQNTSLFSTFWFCFLLPCVIFVITISQILWTAT